jgi:hypothetical protein
MNKHIVDGWEIAESKGPLLKGARIVRCVAHIRHNETGVVRDYNTNEVLEDGESVPSVFNWKENNFSCDCNRELFFGYAAGKVYDDIPDRDCTEGRFSVNMENPVTGAVYYREF